MKQLGDMSKCLTVLGTCGMDTKDVNAEDEAAVLFTVLLSAGLSKQRADTTVHSLHLSTFSTY